MLPGKNWQECFGKLTLFLPDLRARLETSLLAQETPLPLDLWISAESVAQLQQDPTAKRALVGLLQKSNCETTMINGFPFAAFHDKPVKENVYLPDWSEKTRLEYTKELFSLLHDLAAPKKPIAVSTLPGSHKLFVPHLLHPKANIIRKQLLKLAFWLEQQSLAWNRDCHLGLEPEPFGLFENVAETLDFFDFLQQGLSSAEKEVVLRRLGINYDTCHFALQFEDAVSSLETFTQAGIRLSKIHFSNALEIEPQHAAPLQHLKKYDEPVYLHQVIGKMPDGSLQRYGDLPEALQNSHFCKNAETWRIHFHIPLHAKPQPPLKNTATHLEQTLRWLLEHPQACKHWAMETYTCDVLPQELKHQNKAEMIENEFRYLHAQIKTFTSVS